MLEGKTSTLSITAIWFSILGLIIIFQINVVRDSTRLMLSISKWNWDFEVTYNTTVITCDRSNETYDICTINSPTLLDQTSLTLFTLGTHTRTQPYIHMKIQPYPLKNDKKAITLVSEFTLTSAPPKSSCGVTHHSPALVFSVGGYSGNFYHDINEIFIPIFITINSLSNGQDVILVITDVKHGWFEKYVDLLSTFSPNHTIINTSNLTTTHCFPSAIVGLIKHGQMIINPKLLPNPKTLLDFHGFLKGAYMKKNTPLLFPDNKGKPILTLVSRKGSYSREILNQDEVIKLAEDVGFDVHVLEPSINFPVADAFRLIHSSNVMLGVHGAGLTNLVFLRQGSVLVQVVPIGLEWASETYYNKPTKLLGLDYVEYKIEANESSLSWEYGAESLVVKNPKAFRQGKWSKHLVYLKEQNVKIDIIRFRNCLTTVYEKAKKFINSTS
ncbi:xylan glycosyltransferase MUCI21-like [Trifolium pratense]|uniref:xylan glycosyltransferase MUCI21-like n=1 Tax=Trifolium pratense TaxID=57577 RepID=UPI001E697FB2|nr:xylan glycosyltransferase MUCI21-like [Trifolium pratense]